MGRTGTFIKEFIVSFVHWAIIGLMALLGGPYVLASFGFWTPLAAIQSNEGGVWFVAFGICILLSLLNAFVSSRKTR